LARLRYSRKALRDIAALRAYVVEISGSEHRAQAYLERVFRRCATLKSFPTSGRLRPDFAWNIRSVVVKTIVIFYLHTDDDWIYVLRIVDGRRDLGTLFLDLDDL
jgi:plasmid stabilization system protein ParE